MARGGQPACDAGDAAIAVLRRYLAGPVCGQSRIFSRTPPASALPRLPFQLPSLASPARTLTPPPLPRPASPRPADKSGALDFGEWVEWFLEKRGKAMLQEAGELPGSPEAGEAS